MEGTSEEESMDEGSEASSSSDSSQDEESETSSEEDKRKEGLDIYTGEAKIEVYRGEYGEGDFKIKSRSKHNAKTRLNQHLLEYLLEL